jgi:hypothetical protein
MRAEEAAKRFNWVRIAEDGILEFYCDHSMLSALRQCEAYFELSYVKQPQPGHNFRFVERNWALEFGQWFHSCMEAFYWHEYNKFQRSLNPEFKIQVQNYAPAGDLAEWYNSISKGTFIGRGLKLWTEMKMDDFHNHRNYKTLGGAEGALALLSDYHAIYGDGKERMRVIGIEKPFGLKKEVPIIDLDVIQETPLPIPKWLSGYYRAYLSGRLDLIIDDGISIMPVDHKSTAFFDGNEATKFIPHDGMHGYVYACDHMLRNLGITDKKCSKIMINHVCLQQKDKNEKKNGLIVGVTHNPEMRFTRSKNTYTPEMLEEFRLRQAATFDVLYQLIILERPPQWNTGACNNLYYKECPFKTVHGITPSMRDTVLNAQYKIVEEWNPFYESKAEVI